jgi:hypothetical protein
MRVFSFDNEYSPTVHAGLIPVTNFRTDRVETFDEAFKSRIHISLGYPPLDK